MAGGGFILLASAWRVLYQAQQSPALTTFGPYAYVRHPQYPAFILIMLGFLVQWPTLLTLVMFPVLVAIHVRLARREERERSPPSARPLYATRPGRRRGCPTSFEASPWMVNARLTVGGARLGECLK